MLGIFEKNEIRQTIVWETPGPDWEFFLKIDVIFDARKNLVDDYRWYLQRPPDPEYIASGSESTEVRCVESAEKALLTWKAERDA